MNRRVFISYSSVDERVVDLIVTMLAELGVDYFLDRKDIDWGEDIAEKIGEGLAASTELIVILSPASLKSQWVPFEIGLATALNKRVLPFLTHPSLDVPGYLRKFHYKANIEDIRGYFSPKTIPIPLREALRESHKCGATNLELGDIFLTLGDDFASGLPLAIVEDRFFAALGFRFASDSHFDAEELYKQCFVEIWRHPEMRRVIGRLVSFGLVTRPPGPGEYTLTAQGMALLTQLRSEDMGKSMRLQAELSRAIAELIPILKVTASLSPESFRPLIKVRLDSDVFKTVERIEAMCANADLSYKGYLANTGFIARRNADNALLFIDFASERMSQPFEKVLDDVVNNDSTGTYFLNIIAHGSHAAVNYATAQISIFSSDLDGRSTGIWGFCLDTRDERPLRIKKAPFLV